VPGVVLDSMGTTEAIFTTLPRLPEGEAARRLGYSLGCHVVPGKYYAINGIIGSGGLLGWLRRNFWGHITDDAAAFLELERAAEVSGPGARGVVVLPYFAGPGLAHPEAEIRGAVLGLTLRHDAGDVARAALEGLCCEVRFMLEELARLVGTPTTGLRLIGGAGHNALWRRIKADLLGCPVVVPDVTEAGCLGAALLAGMGAGVYRDADETGARVARDGETTEPEPDAPERSLPWFQRFLRAREEAAGLGRITLLEEGD